MDDSPPNPPPNHPQNEALPTPSVEATNALLANLFQSMTDQTSMMPLPTELLPFVRMHNPRMAHSLYHLRHRDFGSSHGMGGPQVQQFMQNWTPITPTDAANAAAELDAAAQLPPILQSYPSSRHPAGTPHVVARPQDELPRDQPPASTGNYFPSAAMPSVPAHSAATGPSSEAGTYQNENSMSRQSSAASSDHDPRSFHAVIGDNPTPGAGTTAHPVSGTDGAAAGGSSYGYDYSYGYSNEQGQHTGPLLAPAHMDREDVVMTNGPDDRAGRTTVVLPSISQFLQDIPAPMAAVVPAPVPVPAPAPKPAGSELAYQWAVVPSTVTSTAPLTDPNSTDDDGEDPDKVPNYMPLQVSDMVLASGMYPEWNAIGIAFQLIIGHLDRGHVEPAGAGFIEVLDYMIRNGRALGIVPQSVYSGTGRAVALRDVRNFWSQFYYFARYVLTEQLLRTKAISSLLADRASAAANKEPAKHIIMGPEMWFSFAGYLDEEWSAYFQHLFPKQALPEYLVPWFAQANVRFVSFTDAERRAEAEANAAAELRAEEAAAAEAALKAEADEKENEAPGMPPADLMPYSMVSQMQDRVRIMRRIMYPSDDKPTQGESDNFLPQMFYDKILALSYECTAHHPWPLPNMPTVHLGLYRLGLYARKTHMDPTEYYGPAL